MTASSINPGFLLILGALVVPFVGSRVRPWIAVLVPLAAGWMLLGLEPGLHGELSILGKTLITLRVDDLSLPFAGIFVLAALLNAVYGWHENDWVQHLSALIYAGAAVAAVFAGDLVSLFVFWEITAVASVFLIWASRNSRAYRAGLRYLIIQIGSGVVLMAGIVLHFRATGSLAFDRLALDTLPGALIFIAFGVKAAFPLMNNWLPDAYPKATVMGTVVLSAFTTKMAIYALARGYPGTELLVWIGAIMAVYATIYALIEHDMRKLLAYSLNSQLGFMVVGVGIGTPLALAGATAHALASVIYQGLLFMAMGAVLLRAGSVRASDLGGLARSMPLTAAFCLIGAASISAMPLMSGFVTKSLILSAATKEGYAIAWIALMAAAAGTVVHSGIRVPFRTFFGPDAGVRCAEAPKGMLLAMAAAAALCVAIGVMPGLFYQWLPGNVDYHAYTFTHVITQIQFLLFAGLAYAVMQHNNMFGAPIPGNNLDSDWIYRRLLPGIVLEFHHAIRHVHFSALARGQVRLNRFLEAVYRHHGPQGALGRTWPVGSTVLWVAVLLCVTLVFYYVE